MTTDISDHLVKFLITPALAKFKMKPKKILTRNFKNVSHENFKNNLRQVNWTDTLKLQLSNVNYLFENFFNKINRTLKHAPCKYLSRKQQKTAGKPWITKGILTSIKIKSKIYNKFCRARNETIKNQLKL